MNFFLIMLVSIFTFNVASANYKYESSQKYPFGQANPNAPKQITDFQDLIGNHTCQSVSRNPDQTWAEPVDMSWTFKYIMNGMAVQDLTLKEDGKHSGSIRILDKDSQQWQVHYYSSTALSKAKHLSMWTGGKEGRKLIFYRNQKAPNGTEGFYRLTFYDITTKGFKWIGEWTDQTETTVYPTWKINCGEGK